MNAKAETAAPGGITANEATLVLHAMTTRSELFQKLMDPRRDIDVECGYPKVVGEAQYDVMYRRELGHRVVRIYAEESWKRLPIIYEDADADTQTPFEESLDALNRRHHLLHYLQRIDELSGIGQYGVILWGIGDGKGLSEPVDGCDQWEEATAGDTVAPVVKRTLLYIRTLDSSLVRIASYETDPTKPRYGRPNTYTVTLTDNGKRENGGTALQPGTTDATVHWSRITHVADNRGTSEVLGTPRMEPVWNRLYDLRKVLGGSGEMFWRGGFPGVSLETQAGNENAEIDEEKTRKMMFAYMNGLQRYLATVGMSAKSLTPQISDPMSSFETHVKAICVTLGIPYRVFMGIEEGVVSGDQATQAWAGRLKNRQERYITPMLIDPVLQRLSDAGILERTAKPHGWTVEWPDLTAPSDKDKAEVSVRRTEAFARYVQGGVSEMIPPLEYLTLFCGVEEPVAQAILEAALAGDTVLGEGEGEDETKHKTEPDGVPAPGGKARKGDAK